MAHAVQTGSECGNDATVATTEVAGEACRWPRGMWLGQRQLLVLPRAGAQPTIRIPQWQPPRHPSFCSLFKRFLLAPLPLHPP